MDDFNKDAKWDFKTDPKLINGELMEHIVYYALLCPDITHEVKSENKSKWGQTGNVYIEFQQLKNNVWVDSGIKLTESDYWTTVLKDYDNETVLEIRMLPTHRLKERINILLKKGKVVIGEKPKTTDGTATRGYLINIHDLTLYDGEYEDDTNKRLKQLSNKNVITTIDYINNTTIFNL
jgi:hypothetical protein